VVTEKLHYPVPILFGLEFTGNPTSTLHGQIAATLIASHGVMAVERKSFSQTDGHVRSITAGITFYQVGHFHASRGPAHDGVMAPNAFRFSDQGPSSLLLSPKDALFQEQAAMSAVENWTGDHQAG
jgi:hypothetical protein